MNDICYISVKELGGSSILAGAALGNSVQLRVLETLETTPARAVCLNFADVACSTASFLREAIFGTRETIRRNCIDTQLLVANVDRASLEELLLVARAIGSSVVHVAVSGDGQPKSPVIVGELDEAQRETLSLVLQLGEATATDLSAAKPGVKPTAWNNRLTSLVSRGILSESKRDRHKLYRPVVKGLSYGS